MKGIIFSVKRYSIHDGPGIRVTFFMKGCPLSCWWCHNPEGISPVPEEIIQKNRVGEKEFEKKTIVGKQYEVKDVISLLNKERVFIEKSGGGVTFSGGEPLMQPHFLLDVLMACKEEGYHTAVDTSGQYPTERLKMILPFTDLFLYDLKHPNPIKHLLYTGVSSDQIMINLGVIVENEKDIMIRIPVIPGINDSEEDLSGFMKIINSHKNENMRMINLLPFHKIGSSKYKKFKRPYRMEGYVQPSQKRMEEIRSYFDSTGIKVKIGG